MSADKTITEYRMNRRLKVTYYGSNNEKIFVRLFINTGGPSYMREIGIPKIGSHIPNLNVKRSRIAVTHITAYNEGHLYCVIFASS